MDFKRILAESIRIDGADREEIYSALTNTADPSHGDLALPCFKFSKLLKKSPQKIAEELAETFPQNEWVSRVEAVNGYFNVTLKKGAFCKKVTEEILTAGVDYGKSGVGKGKTVCIDYSSVNIAKPFHIGHLGTTAIGNALCRILRFSGYRVVGINHLGDWGTQFGKHIVAYRLWGDRDKIEREGVKALQEIYVRFHREEETRPELTEEARRWFKKIEDGDAEAMELFRWFKDITLKEVGKIYDRLGVSFDSYNGESFYNDKMQPVLDLLEQKGLLKTSEGAKVVDLSAFDMPPCLLVKADGATLYATRDLAAAIYRKNTYDFDKSLYVVAYQQNLHFRQFFKVLELMGFAWAKDLVHVAYGMVSLEEGSMSTRAGNVVWLSDVLDQAVEKSYRIISEKNPELERKREIAEDVGVGAVLFSALQNARIKDVTFTFDRVLNFDGETSPYIQYTYARTRSVLRKAEGRRGGAADAEAYENAESMELAKLLNAFPQTARDAAEKYEPSILAKYLIDVSQRFNKFYMECRILDERDGVFAARRNLTEATGIVLKSGLGLLGIRAPEKM